jgi:protocatechuate 3,4-dioxygenase beta subunit
MVRSAPQEKLLSDVLATFANTPDKRLREIINALLRHMHEFVSEVGLTQDEWMTAIKFLTEVGKASTDTRQEFILLSDILGVSSLVEMLNYRGLSGSTENTVMGPFYIPGSPRREVGDSIIETEDDGTRLLVSGVVRSLKGQPIEGATVDVWQTASSGFYPVQDPKQSPTNLRGLFTTRTDGRYEFKTVRPVDYPVPTDGPVGALFTATARHPMRAAHIHLIVGAQGHYPVTTHIFDSESKYLDSDAVFGVRDSLIVQFQPVDDGSLRADFDVTLTPRE